MTDRELDSVRSELRSLGYLDDSVERYLLQDALRPERPGEALRHLTIKVGTLLGIPAAGLGVLALGALHGHLQAAPFDLVPLFVHLALPLVVGCGLGFALLASGVVLLLRLTHARRIEAVSFAVATLAAVVVVLLAVDSAREVFAASRWAAALLLAAVPAAAWGLFKVVHGGLLTLAIRLTDLPPERPHASGRRVLVALVGGTLVLSALALLDAGRAAAPAAPSNLPSSSAGGRVLLLGVDGVLADELEFLVAAGELETLGGLLEDGGVLLPLERPDGPPASYWASAATGVEPPQHGLTALDAYLPLGLSRPLPGDGWLGRWWALLATTPLAEHRPVLAASRRAHAVWELAGRGGLPVVSVGWWGTFPIEPQAGVIVAHGALQLLAENRPDDGIAHPPAVLSALRDAVATERLEPPLARALDVTFGAAAQEIARKALEPDLAYREVFRAAVARHRPRVAALYLAGLDVAAGLDARRHRAPGEASGALHGAVAGELVRWQLEGVEALLGETIDDFDTVLLVVDPGRRPDVGRRQGRLLVWRRAAPCATREASADGLAPGVVASAALRAAGLPQSRELPPPPAACAWPDPPTEVAGFGSRQRESSEVGGDQYLEQLQSLGYL
ncbi:MAG: hypothetical protein AAGC60_21115 [Acidobacteriota bacterium]